MPTIILINPNTSTATTHTMVAIAQACAPAGVLIEGLTAPFGSPLITNAAQLACAAHAVIALTPSIKADGVIVSAFGDPGCDELASLLACPVVGIGAASMRVAATSGRRFSVATTTPELVDSIRSRAAALNLDQQLVSIRLTAGDPTILTADAARLEAALADAVRLAIIEDGAQAVIIGGGPLARAAHALAPQFNVPIIEPIPAAVQAMVQTLMG